MNLQHKYNLSRLRLLFVDDDSDVLLSIGGFLRAFHAEVTTCQSGKAAFDLIAGKVFNLLIIDIQMPEVSGEQLIRAVRAHPDPVVNRLPVVALTVQDEASIQ